MAGRRGRLDFGNSRRTRFITRQQRREFWGFGVRRGGRIGIIQAKEDARRRRRGWELSELDGLSLASDDTDTDTDSSDWPYRSVGAAVTKVESQSPKTPTLPLLHNFCASSHPLPALLVCCRPDAILILSPSNIPSTLPSPSPYPSSDESLDLSSSGSVADNKKAVCSPSSMVPDLLPFGLALSIQPRLASGRQLTIAKVPGV